MTRQIKRGIAIAIVVLAASVGLMSLFTGGGVTPYVGFAEARAAKSNVQVMGELAPIPSTYDAEHGYFIFHIIDANGDKMKVIYSGTKPGNFDQATSVVCIGQYREDSFHADKLLVKCPSKYQNEPENPGA